MFRLPTEYEVDMTFEEAKKSLQHLTQSHGLLEGLQYMDARWNDHCDAEDADDDDFYSTWMYECSAFNIVYKEMKPLFA